MKSILSSSESTAKNHSELTAENIEDIFSSVNTIQSRSQGLIKFVTAYKELAKPPEVKTERMDIVALLKRVTDLIRPDLEKFYVSLTWNLQQPSLFTHADVALMEQVCINLLKNAMEAIPHDGTGQITIGAKKKSDGRIQIIISDNGPGFDQQTHEKIFIPFFTTKQRGSGIGLSFSRQVMKLHGGSIQAVSTPGKGATFILEW